MAKVKYKLKGVDVRQVARVCNRKGQAFAAREFGVSQASISNLLREGGYVAKVVYVRKAGNQVQTRQTATVTTKEGAA